MGSDEFPVTRWTRLLARDGNAAAEFEHLARAYWRPIRAYVRALLRVDEDEAADRTQAFFVWMTETGFLRRAEPGRGRFRDFVNVALRHFLIDGIRSARAAVRAPPGPRGGLAPMDAMGAIRRDEPRSPAEEVARRHRLSAVTAALDGQPSNPGLSWRGLLRLELDDVAGAVADFSAAVRFDPTDAMAHGNRGLVRIRRAAQYVADARPDAALVEYARAIADYDTALTLRPELAGAYNNRGICRAERARLLEKSGDVATADAARDAALRDYDAAVDREPGFAAARWNRAVLHEARARRAADAARPIEAREALERALDDLDRLLESDPSDRRAAEWRARCTELRASLGGARRERAGRRAAGDDPR